MLNQMDLQGHTPRKSTVNRIKPETLIRGGDLVVKIIGPPHIAYLNHGRKPGHRPMVPVDALLAWIKRSNIQIDPGVKPRSVAFVIQRKIFEEGIPTKNSYNFSSNGKRKGYIQDAFEEVKAELIKIVEKELVNYVEQELAAAFRESK